MTTIYGPADMPGANPYCPDGHGVHAQAPDPSYGETQPQLTTVRRRPDTDGVADSVTVSYAPATATELAQEILRCAGRDAEAERLAGAEPSEPAPGLVVAAGAVARVVSAVLPHASDDEDIDAMTAVVRLEAVGSHLLAAATDRYTLAVARTALPAPAVLGATLTVGSAVRLLLDCQESPAGQVDLGGLATPEYEGEDGDPAAWVRVDGTPLRLGLSQAPLPAWRAMLTRTASEAAPEESPEVTTTLVGRALSGLHTPGVPDAHAPGVRLEARGRTLLITCGDWYLAAIAPRRTAEGPAPADLARTLAATTPGEVDQ